MIKGLHHINIVVTDIEAAIGFFRIFGFTVFERKKLEGEWIDRITGLQGVEAEYAGLRHESVFSAVELLEYRSPEGEKSPFISEANSIGIRHFAFQVEGMEDMMRELKAGGVEFFSPMQVNPYGKKMVYIKGPDGIILELAEL